MASYYPYSLYHILYEPTIGCHVPGYISSVTLIAVLIQSQTSSASIAVLGDLTD